MTALVFVASAAASLLAAWVLVVRLERIGARLGVSEALLGLLAALAADAPEITAAVSALTRHQADVGAGVVLGSNVFNLAALLGLAALVAGVIRLHRPVLLLAGAAALGIAGVALLTVTGTVGPVVGLVLAAVMVGVITTLSVVDRARLQRWGQPGRWLALAVTEEELELALHPKRGRPVDVAVGGGALAVVVLASVIMERAATKLGSHVPGIVIGGIVLAAVTSLPNAVAAVYLARRGRGAAVLSTACNSNALNVLAGFLLPAAILGTGHADHLAIVVTAWYGGLTAVALLVAWRHRGLTRAAGAVIVAAYAGFVAVVVVAATSGLDPLLIWLAPALVAVPTVALLTSRRSSTARSGAPGRSRRHGP